MLRTWKNRERAEVVKVIVDHNFKEVGRDLPYTVRAMPTNQKLALTSDYVSEGLIIFDTDLKKWQQYIGGAWVDYSFGNYEYVKDILYTDWVDGEITIPFSEHAIDNPSVHLSIITNGNYSEVVGGTEVDRNYDVYLKTDMPFNGKVVIK